MGDGWKSVESNQSNNQIKLIIIPKNQMCALSTIIDKYRKFEQLIICFQSGGTTFTPSQYIQGTERGAPMHICARQKHINVLIWRGQMWWTSVFNTTILHGRASLLVAHRKDFTVSAMQADVSTSQRLGSFIELLTASGLNGRLRELSFQRQIGLSFCSEYLN